MAAWWHVECMVCGAGVGDNCRTRYGGLTDPHEARVRAAEQGEVTRTWMTIPEIDAELDRLEAFMVEIGLTATGSTAARSRPSG